MRQAGLFGLPDHLRTLSATGDPLEVLAKVVDFEIFRAPLEAALGYSDGLKGGRPAYDAVAMFKVLILAARHTVSNERMEFLIRDRLSWLSLPGLLSRCADAGPQHHMDLSRASGPGWCDG